MKIECFENTKNSLPNELLDKYSITDNKFAVEIGSKYVVYAMTLHHGYIWYYVCDNYYSYYPVWHPSPLFKVIDGKLSRYWIYSFIEGERATLRPRWGFPEWANDPDFYDKLSDGEEREVSIFKHYKMLMDLEFPDASISECAQIGDANWLICPHCMAPWESSGKLDGMVICPQCNMMLHNPRCIPVPPQTYPK